MQTTTGEEVFEDNDSVLAEDEGGYGFTVASPVDNNVSFTQNPLSDTFSTYEPGQSGQLTKEDSDLLQRIKETIRKFREKDLLIPSLTTLTLLLIMACMIVIVVAVTAPFQDITTVHVVDIMSHRSTLLAAHIAMKGYVDLHMTNQFPMDFYPAFSYSFYYFMQTIMYDGLKNMTQVLPANFRHEYMYNTNNYSNAFNQPLLQLWDKTLIGPTCFPFTYIINNVSIPFYIVDFVKLGEAQTVYKNETYTKMLTTYETSFFNFIDAITDYCENISKTANTYYILTISVVGFCFLVVIPTMILTLFLIMKKDRKNEIQLNQTSEFLLKDTMTDLTTRLSFVEFCQKRGFGTHINIIEKIMLFKEYCEQSQEMQMKLIEITSEYVNKVNTLQKQKQFNYSGEKVDFKIDDRKTRAIFMISCEAEKKIKHKEYQKSCLIFEILEEGSEILNAKHVNELIYTYDCYNNQEKMFHEVDILPSMMMDKIEHDLSEALIMTHLDFKALIKNNLDATTHTYNTEIELNDIEKELTEHQINNV